MHKDVLLAANRPDYPKAAVPFASEKDLSDAEMLYRDALAKKVEQWVGYKVLSERLRLVFNFLFAEYNTNKESYGWGFVKTKNRKYDFTDLDNTVITYKAALDSMEKGNLVACQRICSELKATYTKILNSGEERIDKPVKQILYYNLSHVSLLSGNAAEAENYYQLFIGSRQGLEYAHIAHELSSRIFIFSNYFALQKQIRQREEALVAAGKLKLTY